MYNEELEMLINGALADGVLTEKEKTIITNKAIELGVNLDELELIFEAKVLKSQNQNDNDISNDNISRLIQRYRAEFDAIKVTETTTEFKPYTKTGKRGRYINVDLYSESGTKNAQKNYLQSLHPSGKENTLATLEFLCSFLPSCEDVVRKRWDTGLEYLATRKFREVFNTATTDYSSDTKFMQRLKVIQNNFNMLYNSIAQEITIISAKIKKRRISNSVFLALLLFEWLLVDEGWGWCLALNIVSLIVFGLIAASRDTMNEFKDSMRYLKMAAGIYKKIE